jgi:hypothetical protein
LHALVSHPHSGIMSHNLTKYALERLDAALQVGRVPTAWGASWLQRTIKGRTTDEAQRLRRVRWISSSRRFCLGLS